MYKQYTGTWGFCHRIYVSAFMSFAMFMNIVLTYVEID